MIKSLQQELGILREQVGEFNNLCMSVIKTTGKNGVRKLKDKYLTTTDKVNANEITYLLRENLWPHVNSLTAKSVPVGTKNSAKSDPAGTQNYRFV